MAAKFKDVGIVVFDGIERLDLEGPLGVLGWTSQISGDPINIRLLSKDGRPVKDHLLKRSIAVDGATTVESRVDLLLVPGGDLNQFGNDNDLVNEIQRIGSASTLLASICTGAFLVAQTGLADGKRMTTHWNFRRLFRQKFPQITLSEDRYVDAATLWSSAGISAGIDMTLRLIISTWGIEVAKGVQAALEYFPEPPFTRKELSIP